VKVLGISPLDKDATASLVEDGRLLFAAAEERFSRTKHHAGFPHAAVEHALARTGTRVEEIDVVAYPFLEAEREAALVERCCADAEAFDRAFDVADPAAMLRAADARVPERRAAIHGLASPNQRREKGWARRALYRWRGATSARRGEARRQLRRWARRMREDHHRWQAELEASLAALGLGGRLRRYDHHLSHAANAYYGSGFDRALVVTLDGYGTGLAGLVALGEGGRLERLHGVRFPHSLGAFYETVTAACGFHPDRHAGKIVGLAAYGDPRVLADVLLARIERGDGDFRLAEALNAYFAFHLATRYPLIDVAAAYQHVLEIVATDLVRHWVERTGADAVVLSGGVTANVKMNQRIHEVEGVERLFVHPNMGDGGCGTGLGLLLTLDGRVPEPLPSVYLGPDYDEATIEAALREAGLPFTRPPAMAEELARLLDDGHVVARFDGRMEYGPRALGNRSILYHAREPGVNQWLNRQLGRTEFMPFAPVTLFERREACYRGLRGAEHAAQFMTVTADCTEAMKRTCPAAVHVDGTARPQLVRRETNPGYYDVLAAYERRTGCPSLINTSFNMHEEPIVCTPRDAVRAYTRGHLDALAIGPFLVRTARRDGAPRA